jgi:pre-mRNA-processing factor 19
MSYNICALSGKLTNNPVICIKTGLIFDKNAIEQFIESSGICPITNIPINKDDFCEIENERIGCVNNNNSSNNTNGKTNYGIDGIFKEGYLEMEKLVNEVSQLKNKIDEAKKQLTVESYKYEASLCVISQLIQEKENAILELEQLRDEINN